MSPRVSPPPPGLSAVRMNWQVRGGGLLLQGTGGFRREGSQSRTLSVPVAYKSSRFGSPCPPEDLWVPTHCPPSQPGPSAQHSRAPGVPQKPQAGTCPPSQGTPPVHVPTPWHHGEPGMQRMLSQPLLRLGAQLSPGWVHRDPMERTLILPGVLPPAGKGPGPQVRVSKGPEREGWQVFLGPVPAWRHLPTPPLTRRGIGMLAGASSLSGPGEPGSDPCPQLAPTRP